MRKIICVRILEKYIYILFSNAIKVCMNMNYIIIFNKYKLKKIIMLTKLSIIYSSKNDQTMNFHFYLKISHSPTQNYLWGKEQWNCVCV